MHNFKNSVIVLDDMGDKLNNDISYYFTKGRHNNIQIIVMCHKPAQIINTARINCDTIYITTYNASDIFKNFNKTYVCKHYFYGIINDLNCSYYNITAGMASELRYRMIKYIRNKDNYYYY